MMLSTEEAIWEHIVELQNTSADAPETEYREGFLDALKLVREFVEENYEVEAATL